MTRSSARNKGQLGTLGTAHAFLFVDGPWMRAARIEQQGQRARKTIDPNDRAGLKNRVCECYLQGAVKRGKIKG